MKKVPCTSLYCLGAIYCIIPYKRQCRNQRSPPRTGWATLWRQKRTTIGRKRSSPSSCDSAFSHTAKAWIFIAALPFHNRRRFFLACRDGKLGMVRKLLGDGAQIDATDLSGRTGLMLACWKGMDGVAGFLLTSQNADIEPLNIKNRSALHIAAMEGNLRCVQILTTSLQSDWPVKVSRNTWLQRKRCVTQLRPGCSLSLSAPRSHNRTRRPFGSTRV